MIKRMRMQGQDEIELNKFPEEKNGGYTLVEILVAVVILVIVVIPLLHSFVSVARLNSKARKELEATTAAQNIMENIKAAPMKELLAASEELLDDAGNVLLDDAGNPQMKVQVVPDAGNPGNYTIYYNQWEVNGRTYRAVVNMDASTYKRDTEDEEELYNDMSLADVSSMSDEIDAFFIQDLSEDMEAARHLGNETEVYPAMTRDITLDIESASGKTTAFVSVTYTYGGISYSTMENVCIYSNTGLTELENVYLFFQPMYTSSGGVAKESIHVNNNANLPLNVFLVKQSYSSATAAQEMNYRVNVDVNERNRTEFLKDGEYYVLTNLQTNLDRSKNQLKLTYGGFAQETISGRSYTAEELAGLDTDTSLVKKEQKDRLYSVEISIYGQEDDSYGEALVTITGTKEE